MGSTIIELTPLILGSLIAVFEIIIILLFLKDQHNGLGKAVIFLLGIATTRILQGIIFGLVLTQGLQHILQMGKIRSYPCCCWCWVYCC
jgi:hypothetical protein